MKLTRITLLATVALTVLGACGSDTKASLGATSAADTPTAASASGATTPAPPPAVGALGGNAIQLGGDPCLLLTVPEIETVLGSGVEQGGFGEDLPGRCTYSVGGDVGAGVVQIILQTPLECNAVMKALADDSFAPTDAVHIDLGDGGFILQTQVVFTTGGGCVAVGGSDSGVTLDRETLVALATKVAGRVG
jgi:hypothetical protein